MLTEAERAALRFDERGLVPAIVQQHDTGEVLMLAYVNAEALERTIAGGETVFWSRSRAQLWHKGATSGNVQRVVDVRADCDGDTLLVVVDIGPEGVACHTGARTCFDPPGAPRPAAPPGGTGRAAAPPAAGPQP